MRKKRLFTFLKIFCLHRVRTVCIPGDMKLCIASGSLLAKIHIPVIERKCMPACLPRRPLMVKTSARDANVWTVECQNARLTKCMCGLECLNAVKVPFTGYKRDLTFCASQALHYCYEFRRRVFGAKVVRGTLVAFWSCYLQAKVAIYWRVWFWTHMKNYHTAINIQLL